MRAALFTIMMVIISVPYLRAGDELHFTMVPNPASNSVQIETGYGDHKVTVEVYSVIGNRILSADQKTQPGGSIILNLSQIPDGVYLVKVTIDQHSSVKRLKVQHY